MYLDWEKQAQKTHVIDIETDSLDPTVIWVMCWKCVGTGETGECKSLEEIKAFFENVDSDSIFVGHNLLKFDAPVLSRFTGARLGVSNCIDTLVLSTLYSPSIVGGHSLDAWGQRLGKEKIDFHDWSHFSEEMVTYCHQDVAITCELFQRLLKTLNRIEFSETSIWIQHRLTSVIHRQQQNGFYFDGPRALDFYRMLRSREEELQDEIRGAFGAERRLVAERGLYKQNGEHTAIYEKDCQRYVLDIDERRGTYRAFEDVEFNLGSPKQRVDKLTALGWKPREFTEKGNPKPFDKGQLSPSLEEFLETHDVPEVALIAKWMSVNGRANMVNTWLENWNEDTGCIHGRLFVADTLRFRHQSPNTANIPAVRVKEVKDDAGRVIEKYPILGEDGFFTYESRDLWTARPNRILVGTDAAGLELRMLAHFLNRPEFTEGVVNGDPHQVNADIVGITRPQAKTLIYAISYGAGGPKIARTLGLSNKEGEEIKQMFLERLGIGDLIEQCKREQKHGRIELVDGSKVVCPSPHAALNYKLQGSGARVMGLGAINLERAVRKHGLDSLKVGDIHDEWEYDVHPDDAIPHAVEAEEAVKLAGIQLNLNVPLDATSKIGESWSQTH